MGTSSATTARPMGTWPTNALPVEREELATEAGAEEVQEEDQEEGTTQLM